MKYKILTLSFVLLSAFSWAQTVIKQSELQNFNIGKHIEARKPQDVRYKNGKKLTPGKYTVVMDEEGRDGEGMKSSFEINVNGKIDGQMNFDLPDKTFQVVAQFKNDTLLRIDKKQNGRLVESSYFDRDIFYEKEFEVNGDFKSESRSKNGELIYSKGMNLSGWDIKDEIKGTRTFYHGKSDKIESRTTTKNLAKGVTFMEEKFDEKGILESKEIRYADGKKKIINKTGGYEIITPTSSGDKVSQYNSKGKLLKTYVSGYPSISMPQ